MNNVDFIDDDQFPPKYHFVLHSSQQLIQQGKVYRDLVFDGQNLFNLCRVKINCTCHFELWGMSSILLNNIIIVDSCQYTSLHRNN